MAHHEIFALTTLCSIFILLQGPSNYAFGYSVNDEYTGEDFSHTEVRDGYTTSGEYRVALPDGRIQIVTYTADDNGYHADVKYEGVPHPAPAPHPPAPIPHHPAHGPVHPPPPAPVHPAPVHIPEPIPKALPIIEPKPIVPAPVPAVPVKHAPEPIHKGLPFRAPKHPHGYPRALPRIIDHAPLPKAYLPTPTPAYQPYRRSYSPYAASPAPPLKAAHLEPAVYKPKPDPYAAKIGGYIGK